MKNLISLLLLTASSFSVVDAAFRRVGTFYVCSQISATCNTNQTTSAEIVVATADGNTLIYTDSPFGKVGFVNITDPTKPNGLGTLNVLPGEPTSVAVVKGFAVAVINTSPNFTNPSGYASIINITSRTELSRIDLGGQPDSIAVSPDGNTVAIVIENERNEANSVNGGVPPQLPSGFVWILNTTSSNFSNWVVKPAVNLVNLTNVEFPTDAEPEYAAINRDGMVVVTLQENNAVVTINSTTATVVASFSCGSVNLTDVDSVEERNLITQNTNITRKRQPDSVAWIDTVYFATADEGDISTNGGRGFTIFDSRNGNVVYTSNNEMEWQTAKIGHYPEDRSSNRGNEPEGILFSDFNGKKLLFVLSERASVVFVYDVATVTAPVLLQILPVSTAGPEGVVAIPTRNLLAVANEVDDRVNRLRSTISIFQDSAAAADYPSMESVRINGGSTGPFIPFSALSGLAASPTFGSTPATNNVTTLYTVEDSFFLQNRIFAIEVTPAGPPFKITRELRIKDTNNVLATALAPFSSTNVTIRINADKTVNIDPEGIATSPTNASIVWIASEGAGTNTAITLPNFLIKVSLVDGAILQAATLPASVNALHTSNGFEGVAMDGNYAVVAFQRAWVGENATLVRLGLYNTVANTWKFVFYPLDAPTSQFAGGWVGLSDIAPLGSGRFLVLERDNQGGPDAAIKKVYEISLGNLDSIAENTTVTKRLQIDLMPRLAATWGNIPEKVEGLTVDARGTIWLNNDNDGVLNTNGEQQLNNLGLYAPLPPVAAPVAVPAPIVSAPIVAPVAAPRVAPVVAPVAAPLAPVKPPTGRVKCGLLGWSLFCPIKRCGLLGRWLKLCKN